MSNKQNGVLHKNIAKAVDEQKALLTRKFKRQLKGLAKEVLKLIANTSLAKNSGTPYMDDIMEALQGLIWEIKTIERKYK